MIDRTICQWLSIVRADVFDGEKFIPHAEQKRRDIVHKDRKPPPRWDFVRGGDSFKFGHGQGDSL